MGKVFDRINRYKTKLTELKGSNEARVLAENFISLSTLQVINYVFPLITLPYLAKTIGLEKFGALAFATAVMAYFQAFVDFGFNYTAVRDIAQQKDNLKLVSRIFSTIITIRIIFVLISLLILSILIYSIPLFNDNKLILLLTFTYLPSYAIFPEWFFQAMERMKFITIFNTFSKLLFTILVFFVIKSEADYIWHPVLTSLGYFISGIISIYIILIQFKVKFTLPTFQDISNTIKNGWNMFLNIFFPNLYTNFSTILLRIYGGELATGIFDAGNRFINITQQLLNIISRTFFPFLARRLDKHHIFNVISIVVSIPISLTLFFGADLIIKIFYTPEFKDAAIVLKILSFSIFFLVLMNTYGTNYLVLINREKELRRIIVYCSLFGFIFSWIAIIKWGFIGASITFLTVWTIRGLLTWNKAREYK